MTREDLIEKIRIKCDMDPVSTNDDYYVNYYDSLIDECLSVVANTVLPYQNKIEVFYGGLFDETTELSTQSYYKASKNLNLNGVEYKKGDWIYYSSSESLWKKQEHNKYGFIVNIPNDLMSFSREALPMYISEDGDMILDAEVLYLNSRQLALPKDGNYTIWYNSEYPSIEDYTDEELTWLPKNVAKLIPSYVAGQLLSTEDLTRSTILKNEFETMLARIDDNKPMPAFSINNNDGWTY